MEPVTCPFCSPDDRDVIIKNSLWYARWDKYPVTKGHLLVIPFRHVQDCFDLTKDERLLLWECWIPANNYLTGNLPLVDITLG
jgi:diadenosine tetraphosphate (Ap4A) HIT family hydrolase